MESGAAFGLGHTHIFDDFAHWIAGEHYLFGREEFLQPVVSHAYNIGVSREHLVGESRVGVLLLQQCGVAHLGGGFQSRGAGVASHSHHHVGVEVADNLFCHALAFQQFERHGKVFHYVFGAEAALQSGYGQAFDGIARGGHFLHFHAAFGTDEKDVGVGVARFDGVGYGHCGEYVSPCSSSANYRFHFQYFFLCYYFLFLLVLFPPPAVGQDVFS